MFLRKDVPGALPFFQFISNMVVRVTVLIVVLIVASALLYIYPISSSLHLNVLETDRYEASISVFVGDNYSSSQSLPVVPVQGGEEDMVIQKPSSAYKLPRSSEEDGGVGPMTLTHINSVENFGSPNTTNVVDLPELSSVISNQNGASENSGTDNSKKVASRRCDLYRGKWIHDPAGPLYTNNSCPVITQMQNCQGNGRPDKDYENWRWKPEHCDLPRFDARKFLELMRGKTLAFVGDSVARNQMESLLCILWQVEVPKNRGNRRMQRMFFRSTSTTIIRIWSSWLVHQTPRHFPSVPDNVVKVHLDVPDEDFMEFLPNFDVIVVSSGHWFAKQSAYILNGKIVGGQLWQPKRSKKRKINNVEAFGISVETCLTAIASHPNFNGLAIVRSYSPDHYEGGAWNTGGSCTGKVSPAAKLLRNEFTDVMHQKQVTGFKRALRKAGYGSKLILMDITDPFGYRSDGHPGPYRNTDPNKITKRGPNGQPPPQDCLHWCMPGPIDTWNEILLEIIQRELEKE